MKKSSYNSHNVVTNDVIDNEVQVISVDENGNVDEESLEYNEYRNELLFAYRKTKIDNSIVSTFSISNGICKHIIVIKDNNKERKIKEKEFVVNDNFINGFLIPMIEDYKRENLISNSNIELLGEEYANLIVNTKLNDSLIILGSRVEIANKLQSILMNNKNDLNDNKENKWNENGVSNFIAIGLLMIATIMLMVGIFYIISI